MADDEFNKGLDGLYNNGIATGLMRAQVIALTYATGDTVTDDERATAREIAARIDAAVSVLENPPPAQRTEETE